MGFNFFYHAGGPHFCAANFFSYFTNLSNVGASVLLLGLALAPNTFESEGSRAWLRGGATVYMATTGVVYALLLDGTSGGSDPSLPWVNTVVHRIMPLVLVLDWLLVRPGAGSTTA